MGQQASRIHLTLNWDAVRHELAQSLHRIMQRVTLGLKASAIYPDGSLDLDDVVLRFHFGGPMESTADTRLDFAHWLLSNGVREAIEALERLTIELRFLGGLARLAKANDGRIPTGKGGRASEVMDDLRQRETAKFAGANWSTRLECLERDFNCRIDFREEFDTIVRARNCLTHRGGVVGLRDIGNDESQCLIVCYRAIRVVVRRGDEPERELKLPMRVEEGSEIVLRPGVQHCKRFRLGERIGFSEQEFLDLMTTLWQFGTTLTDSVAQYAAFLPESS